MEKRIIERLAPRIEARVNNTNPDECWIWPGARTPQGYGRIGVNEKGKIRMFYPHRIIFAHFNGELEPGQLVMHKCDNPPCCNPDHLVDGSYSDNMKDMCEKERSPNTYLTDDQVRDIRTAYEYGYSQIEIVRDVHPEHFARFKNLDQARQACSRIIRGVSYFWVKT